MASYKQTNISDSMLVDEEETFGYAMQLALGSVLPMALGSANELGLFQIIAEAGPEAKVSATEIAANWLVACVGKFGSQLKDAVLEGGVPFERIHGSHAFEYPGLDARFNQVFNTAMYNQTTIIINNILQRYNGFEQLKELVDVGGGLGVTLALITSKYPHIKAINFDLPHVIQHASPYSGVEHVGGYMFESVPTSDAVFMKWILHDWSDERCLILLKNCHNVLPKDGKVIVVEAILPVEAETSAAVRANAQTDVLMMTQNPGGKERTKEEFVALANEAGFSDVQFKCFVCNFWVMEFIK